MLNVNDTNLRSKRRLNEINQNFLMNIFQTNNEHGQTLTGLNGQFVNFQILMDVLLRMKITMDDKNEFIDLCKRELNNDKTELKILYEFKENYSSDQALWWYTRETFIYQILNQTLRLQDIDFLFFFRFFIFDIEKQLELNQCLAPIRVYRGQYMSNEELNKIKSSVGQFLSTNSFLSTSIDMQEALSFLDYSILTNNFQRVLFIIDANPDVEGIKSFANITSHSYFNDEQEVLFMLGSIFRINRIYFCNKDHVWIVNMNLCGDYDQKLKEIFDHMKNEYGEGETGLLSFGRVLRQMGKFDEAEKYYQRFLNQLQPDDYQNKAQCYHLLGNIVLDKGNYDLSLEYHLKSLEIKIENCPSNDSSLAYSHNSIGIIYWKKENHEQALESYNKALQIWIETYSRDDLRVAMCFNNMGIIYDDEKKYTEALKCYKNTLAIRLKHLPNGHCHIGDTYNNIGAVHRSLGHYDLALDYFNHSLEIYKKTLFSQHPSIASTWKNIGIIYEIKEDFIQALEFYEKAAEIFHQTLPVKHPDVIEINQLIRDVRI
jgi:tetratricopeptide (TPR) repeat protein